MRGHVCPTAPCSNWAATIRFRQGNAINAGAFTTTASRRTNRPVFTKLQYRFRSGGDT
jgi:hypothetical protein